MTKSPEGYHQVFHEGLKEGDLYQFRLEGQTLVPDPASRFQPRGVHGPSQIVDPASFKWTDQSWPGIPEKELIIYEIHTGTFTPSGTFSEAAEKLDYLKDLGVTALELMPIADFPGQRNWGYDGVNLFAPARCYGRPDDLRRFVDQAHRRGMAVLLDVVYNHFGPDGNYLSLFSPDYFTSRYKTPWGAALNYDGKNSEQVRRFFLENALAWLGEYHFDGLRLDATHAIMDSGPRHFLSELTEEVEKNFPNREIHLIAEDHRNLAKMIEPRSQGGWGLTGVWADDFHHQIRARLAGDKEGYYGDFEGSLNDIAETVREGWFYRGQYSTHQKENRGTETAGVPLHRFVICLQNHDQIGNRAFGERLHHQVDVSSYKAALALLMMAPETPLLFMGQEWAASTPFLFFTDHNPDLGALVTEGRRREFKDFQAFQDPTVREKIPDPQAESTFLASKLKWQEISAEASREILLFTTSLLELRKTRMAELSSRGDLWVDDIEGHCVGLVRPSFEGGLLLGLFRLGGDSLFTLELGSVQKRVPEEIPLSGDMTFLMSSEDSRFSSHPNKIEYDLSPSSRTVTFNGPGAIIFSISKPSTK